MGFVLVQSANAQSQNLLLETKACTDVTRAFAGTWKLKERINPDGTPYRSPLQGVTYVSMRTEAMDSVGPHAVAIVHARESGIADSHFYNYPEGIAGKPFVMESAGTWLIHNIKRTDTGMQVSVRTSTMAKGTVPPYTDGMLIDTEIVFNVLQQQGANKARAAMAPRVELANLIPGNLTNLAGNKLSEDLAATSCFGMTSITVTPDTMNVNWSHNGKDVWVKSSSKVPTAFR